MSFEAEFFVQGIPEPKGSMRALIIAGKPQVIPNNKRSKKWEYAVKLAASHHAPKKPLDEPIRVEFYFKMPSPKKPKFSLPATKPDWDKLCRSTGDALTKVIYFDDARITDFKGNLRYSDKPGCLIRVIGLGDQLDLF